MWIPRHQLTATASDPLKLNLPQRAASGNRPVPVRQLHSRLRSLPPPPATDENSETITEVMKTCCSPAVPAGRTRCPPPAPSRSAAASYGRKRIGNTSGKLAICCRCAGACGLEAFLFSECQAGLKCVGVPFGKPGLMLLGYF